MKTILLAIIAIAFSVNMVYGEFEKWQNEPEITESQEDENDDASDQISAPGAYRVAINGANTPSKKRKPRRPQIIKTKQRMAYTKADEKCLAMNIFYEAGIESKVGQVAVGQVTLNRLKAKRWGNTICNVVYAKSQFSWTLYDDKRNVIPSGENWIVAQQVAREVLDGARVSSLGSSLYYHTHYIKTPKWAGSENKIDQIGQHLFYTKARMAPPKNDMRT